MSVNVQMASRTLQKKRLDLEDSADVEGPKLKRPRLAQLPSPSLTPCLQAPIESPVVEAKNQSICSIGPYVLLEATEGAQCYWAVHRGSEEQYTCKIFPMKRYQELFAPYARLPPHEHIGRIEEIITGEQKVYMVFPKSHGDMHSHVRLSKRLPEAEAAPLFRQMAAAVAHCHSHGVILRDLKLRKFVFADKQRNKLVLENLEDSCVLRGEDDLLTDKHGCPAYVGPEILNSKHSYSGRAADIWSLGVVLYTMLVGRYPFQDAEPAALFSKIRRGTYSIPESLSPKAKCLIRCLLRKNPAERLSGSEILLHPWLNSSNMATISPSTGPVDSVSLEQVVPDFEKYEDVDFL